MLNSYKDLIVWQKSIDLVIEIYRITYLFPKSELYGLTNHIRKTVISIPSNIAEGFSRKHKQENIQFLRIAFGSGAELETQIVIVKRLKFIDLKEFEKTDNLLEEIQKMLNKFIANLVAKS